MSYSISSDQISGSIDSFIDSREAREKTEEDLIKESKV